MSSQASSSLTPSEPPAAAPLTLSEAVTFLRNRPSLSSDSRLRRVCSGMRTLVSAHRGVKEGQAHLIVVLCPFGPSKRLLLLNIRLLARWLRRPRPRVRAPPRPLVASSIIPSSPSWRRRPRPTHAPCTTTSTRRRSPAVVLSSARGAIPLVGRVGRGAAAAGRRNRARGGATSTTATGRRATARKGARRRAALWVYGRQSVCFVLG